MTGAPGRSGDGTEVLIKSRVRRLVTEVMNEFRLWPDLYVSPSDYPRPEQAVVKDLVDVMTGKIHLVATLSYHDGEFYAVVQMEKAYQAVLGCEWLRLTGTALDQPFMVECMSVVGRLKAGSVRTGTIDPRDLQAGVIWARLAADEPAETDAFA